MNASRITRAMAAVALWTAALPYGALAQEAPAPVPEAAPETPVEVQPRDGKGVAPRASATDYQAHASAGKFTIAAEFKGHSIPTPEATFTSEDYVSVEVGVFGPADARLTVKPENFSLRVVHGKGVVALQAKKTPSLPAQPYELVFKSLKDPSWEPPVKPESKGKTTIGDNGNSDPPPAAPKMPFDLVRAMDQKVQRASLPEGERPLPLAGLVYFYYHGKTDTARSIQLLYSGPAGAATLELQP